MIDNLKQEGFAIVCGALRTDQLVELHKSIEKILEANPSAGIRGLAQKVPSVRLLSESYAIRMLVEPCLGPSVRLVRSVLFNKDQETNWQVAWHQDLTVAVECKADVEGFISWSIKDGIAHVQPPVGVLEKMLTVRLHLDAADENNGALWISPGSHRLGRLPAGDAAAAAERHGKRLCAVQPGDALLFFPLVLHASRKSVSGNPRRVIHLEFAGAALPYPLVWKDDA